MFGEARRELDQRFVFGLPDAGEVRLLLVVADLVRSVLELPLVPEIDGMVGNDGAVVFEAERVDEDEAIDGFGEGERVASRQHSSHRMTDDRAAIDTDAPEQLARVRGKAREAVLITFRLARFAEADLIRRDDAVVRRRSGLESSPPSTAAVKFFP